MGTKTAIETLTGTAAIRYAQVNPEAVMICAYAGRVNEARNDIAPPEAWQLSREDPTLIYLEERTTIYNVAATDVQPGETNAGGWDVTIELTGQLQVTGEVTMLPVRGVREIAAEAWGSRDQWMSRELNRAIDRLPEQDRIGAADEIEALAAIAIEASRIDAAE